MLFMMSVSAAALTVTTADGKGADTYLSNDGQSGNYGPASLHGTDAYLAVRRYDGIRQKILYVRFDLTGVSGNRNGATLSFNLTSSNRTRVWGIYGLTDETLDKWDEAIICYNNAPGMVSAPLACYAIDETKLRKLGTMNIVNAAGVYTSATTSLNLDSFLTGDTNKLVTFLVIPESTDSNASWWVSSRESATPDLAPALTIPNASKSWFVAHQPSPGKNATDVPSDVILTWQPGQFAVAHNVYFGTNSEDVANASASVLVGPGQDANTYDPHGRLAFGQTYYWRVDEVNGAPDFAVQNGPVWSFTVEPYSYQITDVIATASSFDIGAPPENTVNGSGLDVSGLLHSTLDKAMWISGKNAAQPTWIQYEFPGPYKLHEMWVWNYNVSLESAVGAGCKDVKIEYSLNGTDWTVLSESMLFQPGASSEGYAHNTSVDFDGAAAKYVKLTPLSNWGGLFAQYGLSEVRFFYVPVSAAKPVPAPGATDVDPRSVVLSWRSGREAALHELYFGADQQAVADGAVPAVTPEQASYALPSLQLDLTYYWKVVEVNQAETPTAWTSDLWSFSTLPYITIDDFESYTNDSPYRVFQTWIDGSGFSADEFFPSGHKGNATGSLVGYDPLVGDIMETGIVHGGRQSMPLYYDNSDIPRLSETRRTFDPPQDWTELGITTLVLHFRGDANNVGAPVYVKIDGVKVLYNDGAAGTTTEVWTQWNIDLASLGVSLTSIRSLTIGVGDGLADATGIIYVDDILLYATPPQIATPADPGTNGLVAQRPMESCIQSRCDNPQIPELNNVRTRTPCIRSDLSAIGGRPVNPRRCLCTISTYS